MPGQGDPDTGIPRPSVGDEARKAFDQVGDQAVAIGGEVRPRTMQAREALGQADRDYAHVVARSACEIIRACLAGDQGAWAHIERYGMTTEEMRALRALQPNPAQREWLGQMFKGGGQSEDGPVLKALESVFIKCAIRTIGPKQAYVLDIARDPTNPISMGPVDCRPYCGPS